MAKKAPVVSRAPSLLEAWLGYIYGGNTCADGVRALHFLRGCLRKKILKDADVWAAASDEIKAAARKQFANGADNPKIYALKRAVEFLRTSQSSSLKATEAELAILQAKQLAASPCVRKSGVLGAVRFDK